jgi:hypothetical protein
MAEHQQAVEQLAEKENEIYQRHEANLAAIDLQKRELADLRNRYEQEKLDALGKIEQERLSLEESKVQSAYQVVQFNSI